MKISLLADAINLPTGILTVGAPIAAALPAPVGDAGKELLTVVVGIVSMLLTKAAGKLFDRWFGKKEDKPAAPVIDPNPVTPNLNLQKLQSDGNEETQISK